MRVLVVVSLYVCVYVCMCVCVSVTWRMDITIEYLSSYILLFLQQILRIQEVMRNCVAMDGAHEGGKTVESIQ